MQQPPTTCERVQQIFHQMNLDVPSPDLDLIDTGALDSIAFVELLVRLEDAFGVRVSLDDLDIDYFRSIRSIAAFVDLDLRRTASGAS